jgi:hypothetical protein
MVFLSAQPDEYYFTWQIELQIFNFNKLGILPENIHILIGYDPKKQLSHYFHDLIDKWKHKASFFVYPDERQQKNTLLPSGPISSGSILSKSQHCSMKSFFIMIQTLCSVNCLISMGWRQTIPGMFQIPGGTLIRPTLKEQRAKVFWKKCAPQWAFLRIWL